MRAKTEKREAARHLRRKGWSIRAITSELEVAKSSVSVWVRDIPQPSKFTPDAVAERKERRLKKEAEERQKRRRERELRRQEKIISGDGRWMLRTPPGYQGTTYIGGRYIYEHRYLMEQKIGRLLGPDEVVHHINEDKLDNRIENLELMSRADHVRHHKTDRV